MKASVEYLLENVVNVGSLDALIDDSLEYTLGDLNIAIVQTIQSIVASTTVYNDDLVRKTIPTLVEFILHIRPAR